MDLKRFVEELVRMTVFEPDVVKVDERNDRGTKLFSVTVAPNDVGRVIGKDGRVISCIRQLVSAVGAKAHQRTAVKILAD
ncbi:MAG: KH domain-containing protein [Armatimonadetes bacterium]|nr:KH domain-containing protein [Armatimonadota bacterium]